MFAELLRSSPDLLTFSAEINPHVTITTLGSGGGCDVVEDPTPYAGTDAGLDVLRTELGNDLGRPAAQIDTPSLARHIAWRLTMQWPHEPIEPATVRAALDDREEAPWDWTTEHFLDLLAGLSSAYPSTNPYRYDIDAGEVAHRFPHQLRPVGPPAEPVVEMAPFVVPRAWQVADASEAARRPVVTTTPRNAFRLHLLARTFPNARLRVIHLTRNPAAAVNGLRDGWLHSGFVSGRSDTPLRIAGYSDRYPRWGSVWWNYDVPPAWRDWTDRPLVEVCGFQWAAAQTATVEGAASLGADVHRIAFEDIAGARRETALAGLCEWLQIDPAPLLRGRDVPVVIPTAPPRPRRWADNAEALEPVLRNRSLREYAGALGYSQDPNDWT